MRRITVAMCDPILNLWKGREQDEMKFSKIRELMKAIDPQRWYERKIIRYLRWMVTWRLLERRKEGKNTFYKTTSKAHEYEASSFFERIREETQKIGWITEKEESFRVYGIPPETDLTSLENEVLAQTLRRIQGAFYDLHSLKRSIIARREVGQPMSCDLLRGYLLEKAAYLFKEQVWQKVYDADSNDIENVIKIAKQRGVEIPDPERFLEMEKQWLSPEGPVFNYRPLGSFEESCLAVLAMLPPDLMEEYFLDSFNYLKDTIETIQNEKMPLTDRSLVIIAEDFLKRERLSRRPHVADRILVLRKWPWLRHELGDEKTEKLVKIIYYFWQTNKAQTAKTKVEGKLEAAEPEIHVLTDEERRQEIERIVRESQKISFSKLQKESLQ